MTTKKTSAKKRGRKAPRQAKTGLVWFRVSALKPSPENDKLYRPVDPADPDVLALADSMRQHRVLEPLVVTLDGYVLSGHRRLAAAKLAGLKTVPCRMKRIRRTGNTDRFVRLLAHFNRQRTKTFSEKLRETAATIDKNDAYSDMLTDRADESLIEVETIILDDYKPRASISPAKLPMLHAVQRIIDERKKFWPLSDRQIHYPLLNDPPLRHASKPKSRYKNDRASYCDLCDVLTRARLTGQVPFEAIADETRPVVTWDVYRDSAPFLRKQLDRFCKGYFRDLQQTQPNHIEVVVEKNTVATICKSVCGNYCVPMTSGRGYCSLPPRHAMGQRYRRAGKDKLILLIVSDFDPEGESIAESFARSMRDDFGIEDLAAVKVALTASQVKEYELPPEMTVKSSSSRAGRFTDLHGENVWELEALPPETLQELLDAAIRNVMDLDAYNREVELEAEDARQLNATRIAAADALQNLGLGE